MLPYGHSYEKLSIHMLHPKWTSPHVTIICTARYTLLATYVTKLKQAIERERWSSCFPAQWEVWWLYLSEDNENPGIVCSAGVSHCGWHSRSLYLFCWAEVGSVLTKYAACGLIPWHECSGSPIHCCPGTLPPQRGSRLALVVWRGHWYVNIFVLSDLIH